MRRRLRRTVSALAAAGLLVTTLTTVATATAGAEPTPRAAATDPTILTRAAGAPAAEAPPDGTGSEKQLGATSLRPRDGDVSATSAGIVVTTTGFSPQARAALEFAADRWTQFLVSSVPIEIFAEYSLLDPDPDLLGGSDTFMTEHPCGSLQAATDYPAALADAICGSDLDPEAYDGTLFFNSASSWYFGTDGNVPGGSFDFATAAMQAIGHVLGYIGTMDVQGGMGSYASPPTIYDRQARDSSGNRLTDTAAYANPSAQLAAVLQNFNVYMQGPATLALSGFGAALWAPNPWEPGASFNSLSESAYPNSFPTPDPNTLMTPYLSPGEVIRSPGPMVTAVLKDLGWTLPSAPGAPSNVQVVSTGSSEATVSFSPPATNGGSRVTKYVVATPYHSVEATGSPVNVSGLHNDEATTFTVRAANPFGTGPPSAPSASFTPRLHGFHPMSPTRILDTRFGVTEYEPRNTALAAGEVLHVQIVEAGFIDAATSVVMNVTAVSPSAYGWLKVYPKGTEPPNASNLNFQAHQTVPNLVTVGVGTDGQVSVANSDGLIGGGSTHVIFDVVGYYTGDSTGAAFTPTAPTRILDTRPGSAAELPRKGALAPQEVLELPGSGLPPISGRATSIVMNVTVVSPEAPGWLTVFPADQTAPPTASNLNYVANQTVPNLVTVKAGVDGHFKVANTFGNSSAGFTHVIIDIVGWYAPPTTGTTLARGLNAATPYRTLDTRVGVGVVDGGGPHGPLSPTEIMTVKIAGVGPVPEGAAAVMLNVTVVTPSRSGWLKVFPAYSAPPNASNLNFSAGQVVPNLVAVPLSSDGRISISNTDGSFDAGYTHVIIDVVAWFGGTPGYVNAPWQATGNFGELPFGYARTLVVDEAREQVFISGEDAIYVTDLSGNFVDIIGHQNGAWGMVLDGDRLFVALSDPGAIGEIDAETLEIGDRVPITQDPTSATPVSPTSLLRAGGQFWFAAGASTDPRGVGRFDPGTASAVLKTTGLGTLYRPRLAASPDPPRVRPVRHRPVQYQPASHGRQCVSPGHPQIRRTRG